jgi:phosphoribosylglycinamide formyltransferase-1
MKSKQKMANKNIAVMASGAGTTFNNLALLSSKGIVNFGISTLLTNNTQAECVDVGVKYGIQAIVVKDDSIWDLIPENTDLIVLAGWLKLLNIPSKWKNKVLNIHPSLLPKYGGKGFYGINVHKAVMKAEEAESGCTVHLVDNDYDTGRILWQEKVSIAKYDTPHTLQTKIQILERKIYPKAIDHYLMTHDKDHRKNVADDYKEVAAGWSGL